jgi:hypothetical protein
MPVGDVGFSNSSSGYLISEEFSRCHTEFIIIVVDGTALLEGI